MSTSELAVSTVTSARSTPVRGRPRQGRHGLSYWHPRIQAAADFVTVACGIWLAYLLHADRLATVDHWHGPMEVVGAALIVVTLFAQLGAYSPQTTPMNIVGTEKLVRGISFAVAIGTAGCIYAQGQISSLAWSSALAVMILLVVQREIGHLVTDWVCQRGYGVQRVLIYGSPCYSQVEGLLTNSPHLGKVCVGFVHDMSGTAPAATTRESGSLGSWSDLERIAREQAAAEVMVATPSVSQDKLAEVARDCERLNLRLSVVLNMLDGHDWGFRYELLGNIPIASYDLADDVSKNLILKPTIDVVSASVLLVLLSPLFLLTAILIKLDSQGPVFFRHERVGKKGRRFLLWKFRSMRADSLPYERSPAGDSDARLTRVGRVLRRLSVDELPQLINVLKGDMSLVGPRPEMPFIVQRYGPLEQRRLKVKPGITGLWQISPARAKPIHENMEFDLFYIEHQNAFLDCAILLRTITAVIRGVGAA